MLNITSGAPRQDALQWKTLAAPPRVTLPRDDGMPRAAAPATSAGDARILAAPRSTAALSGSGTPGGTLLEASGSAGVAPASAA